MMVGISPKSGTAGDEEIALVPKAKVAMVREEDMPLDNSNLPRANDISTLRY